MAHRFFPAVQAAILCHLADHSDAEHGYDGFAWPGLTPEIWRKVQNDPGYADRQEFVGDSLVHTAIALRVRARYPGASSDSYTAITQALVSNATFFHLTCRRPPTTHYVIRRSPRDDEYRVRIVSMLARENIKPGGDRFETCVAEYHDLHGFPHLLDWLNRLFDPLITIAWTSVTECHTLSREYTQRRSNEMRGRFAGSGRPRASGSTALRDAFVIHSASHGLTYATERAPPPPTQPVRDLRPANRPSTLPHGTPQRLGDGSLKDFAFNFDAAHRSSALPRSSPMRVPPVAPLLSAPSQPVPSSVASSRHMLPVSHASPLGARSRAPLVGVMDARQSLAGPSPSNHHQPPPEVIDLTGDDDDDEREAVPLRSVDVLLSSGLRGSPDPNLPARHQLPLVVEDFIGVPSEAPASEDDHYSDMDISFANEQHPGPCQDLGPLAAADEPAIDIDEDSEDAVDAAEVEHVLTWISALGPAVDKVVERGALPLQRPSLSVAVKSVLRATAQLPLAASFLGAFSQAQSPVAEASAEAAFVLPQEARNAGSAAPGAEVRPSPSVPFVPAPPPIRGSSTSGRGRQPATYASMVKRSSVITPARSWRDENAATTQAAAGSQPSKKRPRDDSPTRPGDGHSVHDVLRPLRRRKIYTPPSPRPEVNLRRSQRSRP